MEHVVLLLKRAVLLVVGFIALDVARTDMECVVLSLNCLICVVPLIQGKSGNEEAFRCFLFQIAGFFLT